MATIVATGARARGRAHRVGIGVVLLGFALAAVLAAVGLIRGTSPVARPGRAAPAATAPAVTTVPATPPPAVPPTVFADLTPDQARASNALVPYAAGTPPLPTRFVYAGSAQDRDAALTCLAAAVLYEAGDDRAGEQAVAQVVLNRLRHPAFPKTVCGVVLQGSERSTGCQFTFTCDGALDRPPRPEAWTRAKAIADAALSGHVDADVGTATHYHTDWVVPYWRGSLVKLARVHTQIFYRWPGGWGQPRAFVGRPQPFERLDPRLVPLAGPAQAAFADAEPMPPPAPDDLAAPPPPAAVPLDRATRAALHGGSVRLSDPAAGQYVVRLGGGADGYAGTARALCRAARDCMVFGWRDPALMPRRLPFIPQGVQGMTFLFRRSSVLRTEQALWNCRQVRREDIAQCLPGTR